MAKSSSISKKQRLINKLIPAAIFIFLAIVWQEEGSMVRILFGIAGIAFVVEGLIRFRKDKKSESN